MGLGTYLDVCIDKEINMLLFMDESGLSAACKVKTYSYYNLLSKTNRSANVLKAFTLLLNYNEPLNISEDFKQMNAIKALKILEASVADDETQSSIVLRHLFLLYSENLYIKTNTTKAQQYLIKAAVANDALSQFYFYSKYTEGFFSNLDIDHSLADYFLKQAINNNNEQVLKTACTYFKGQENKLDSYGKYVTKLYEINPVMAQEFYNDYAFKKSKHKALESFNSKDYITSFSLLQNLYAKDCTLRFYYAKSLYLGLGTHANKQHAIAIFNTLLESQEVEIVTESLFIVAKAYLDGEGIEKNINKGIEILQKLAIENVQEALELLGQYKKGLFKWKKIKK